MNAQSFVGTSSMSIISLALPLPVAIAAIAALTILTGIWWLTAALFGSVGMMVGMGR